MRLKMPYPRDVFCIEGHWSPDLRDESTVRHALQLLKDLRIIRHFIHCRITTREEFLQRLKQWCQKQYSSYSVGYFAFHGHPGQVCLDGKHVVTLDEIAEQMYGKGKGRFVHFSCCETLHTDRRNLTRFLRNSGCGMISGYTGYVDWVDSAAFEMMLFRDLQCRKHPASIEYFIHYHHPDAWALGRRLKWRMEYLRSYEK